MYCKIHIHIRSQYEQNGSQQKTITVSQNSSNDRYLCESLKIKFYAVLSSAWDKVNYFSIDCKMIKI